MNKQTKGVTLKNVTREYISPSKEPFLAVDNISLNIQSGEFVTLLGPSGCGKTTTLRMIAGFEVPTEGEIFIGEESVNKLTPDRRDTAMVFQSYALFPHYNVYNNISFGLRLKKMSEKEISEKVKNIMDLVGLAGLEERFPNQLSGGQQQRVALARALVSEPAVMLFDEPLSNLDAKLRTSMRNEIKKIQHRLGLTSIYVTHDQTEAMALSDRIIVMNHGIIEQIGEPQEVYFRPASKFVADFIGRSNFAEGIVRSSNGGEVVLDMLGQQVTVKQEDIPADLVGKKVCCMTRPESLLIGKEGTFTGTVQTSTFMGSMQEYFVDVQGTQFIIEDYNFVEHGVFTEGEQVGVTIKFNGLHLINE